MLSGSFQPPSCFCPHSAGTAVACRRAWLLFFRASILPAKPSLPSTRTRQEKTAIGSGVTDCSSQQRPQQQDLSGTRGVPPTVYTLKSLLLLKLRANLVGTTAGLLSCPSWTHSWTSFALEANVLDMLWLAVGLPASTHWHKRSGRSRCRIYQSHEAQSDTSTASSDIHLKIHTPHMWSAPRKTPPSGPAPYHLPPPNHSLLLCQLTRGNGFLLLCRGLLWCWAKIYGLGQQEYVVWGEQAVLNVVNAWAKWPQLIEHPRALKFKVWLPSVGTICFFLWGQGNIPENLTMVFARRS